jgi:hypothetical protein
LAANKRPPTVDAELGRQIASDLGYLQDTWNQERIDDDFLRRDSVVLRRLLIDNGGGLLRTYRKQLGHRGDVKVEAVEINETIADLDRAKVRFASAGGATHAGMSVRGVVNYAGAMPDGKVKERFLRGPEHALRKIGLARYLDATCLIVQGVSVSRRSLIQYIANRGGGVHYDETRDVATERAYLALDTAMEGPVLADRTPCTSSCSA